MKERCMSDNWTWTLILLSYQYRNQEGTMLQLYGGIEKTEKV